MRPTRCAPRALTRGGQTRPTGSCLPITFQIWEAAGCPPEVSAPGEKDVVGHAPDGAAIERYRINIPVVGSRERCWKWAPSPAPASVRCETYRRRVILCDACGGERTGRE